ncbi:hypothetical protein KA183_02110 [bacterium]|nr:hypothetical protein [bacterium]
MNLDITKPLALMSVIIGVILYLYGQMVAMPFAFDIPHGVVPIKIDQPCGLFYVLFGFVVWQFGRFSKIKTLHAGIKKREKELKIKEPTEKVESAEEIKSVENIETIETAKPEKSEEK